MTCLGRDTEWKKYKIDHLTQNMASSLVDEMSLLALHFKIEGCRILLVSGTPCHWQFTLCMRTYIVPCKHSIKRALEGP